MQIEFSAQALAMISHCYRADAQNFRDFFDGERVTSEPENLSLSAGQL